VLEKTFQIFQARGLSQIYFRRVCCCFCASHKSKIFSLCLDLHLCGGWLVGLFHIYYYQEMVLVDGVIKVNNRSHFYFFTVNNVLCHLPVENYLTTNRAALWEVK